MLRAEHRMLRRQVLWVHAEVRRGHLRGSNAAPDTDPAHPVTTAAEPWPRPPVARMPKARGVSSRATRSEGALFFTSIPTRNEGPSTGILRGRKYLHASLCKKLQNSARSLCTAQGRAYKNNNFTVFHTR